MHRHASAPRTRNTLRAGLALFACVALAAPSSPRQAARGTAAPMMKDLAWISGTWVLESQGSRTEEHWSAAASNAILGMSRTLRGERMVEFEYLRIVQKQDGIYYVAQPGGRPATEFKLTKLEGQSAVFENPQHDFPKRIIYARNADGSLTARIDAGEGSAQGMDFPFKPLLKK